SLGVVSHAFSQKEAKDTVICLCHCAPLPLEEGRQSHFLRGMYGLYLVLQTCFLSWAEAPLGAANERVHLKSRF
uniref:Uncharacterized protein n=1 Tax=Ursus americanus TaxID=9643 RepID=A0A452Q840_URSAM